MYKDQIYALFLFILLFYLCGFFYGEIFFQAIGIKFLTCYLFSELVFIFYFIH